MLKKQTLTLCFNSRINADFLTRSLTHVWTSTSLRLSFIPVLQLDFCLPVLMPVLENFVKKRMKETANLLLVLQKKSFYTGLKWVFTTENY